MVTLRRFVQVVLDSVVQDMHEPGSKGLSTCVDGGAVEQFSGSNTYLCTHLQGTACLCFAILI